MLVAYPAQTVIDVNNLPNFSFWAEVSFHAKSVD